MMEIGICDDGMSLLLPPLPSSYIPIIIIIIIKTVLIKRYNKQNTMI